MVAADDTDAAVVTLVAVLQARLERTGQDFAPDQVTLRRPQLLRVEPQVSQVDLAAMVGAVEGEQPRLEGDEGDRMGCVNRATQYTAAIGKRTLLWGPLCENHSLGTWPKHHCGNIDHIR